MDRTQVVCRLFAAAVADEAGGRPNAHAATRPGVARGVALTQLSPVLVQKLNNRGLYSNYESFE